MNNLSVHGEVDILGSLSLTQNHLLAPANPKPRQIAVIDGRPCIWSDIGQGFYTWVPMGMRQSSYVHSQGIAAATWTIQHNMDTTDYGVFVYDADKNLIIVSTTIVDSNTITINIGDAMIGTAVVFGVPGQAALWAPTAISIDPDNRLTRGTDRGLFVQDLLADPLAYYILSRN